MVFELSGVLIEVNRKHRQTEAKNFKNPVSYIVEARNAAAVD
jgi:hypothetical protein